MPDQDPQQISKSASAMSPEQLAEWQYILKEGVDLRGFMPYFVILNLKKADVTDLR